MILLSGGYLMGLLYFGIAFLLIGLGLFILKRTLRQNFAWVCMIVGIMSVCIYFSPVWQDFIQNYSLYQTHMNIK